MLGMDMGSIKCRVGGIDDAKGKASSNVHHSRSSKT
jgi:hypothetical protein